jgi:hypothetical protein
MGRSPVGEDAIASDDQRRVRWVDLREMDPKAESFGSTSTRYAPSAVRCLGWSDEQGPVELALADDALLHVLVGVDTPKEQAKGGIV